MTTPREALRLIWGTIRLAGRLAWAALCAFPAGLLR